MSDSESLERGKLAEDGPLSNSKLASASKNKDNPSISGRWNKDEHDKFIEALRKFGKDWKQVEQHIESRTGAQIRSHAQKFFNRIIKKYSIEKGEVIDFISNAYNSNNDSSLNSPKKKRKGEAAAKKKTSLYVFNEEPSISHTLQNEFTSKGKVAVEAKLEVPQESLSRQLDFSVDDHIEMSHPASVSNSSGRTG